MKYLGPEDRVVTVLSDPGMKVSGGKLMEPSKRLRSDVLATGQRSSEVLICLDISMICEENESEYIFIYISSAS